jgi:hypothetical protein
LPRIAKSHFHTRLPLALVCPQVDLPSFLGINHKQVTNLVSVFPAEPFILIFLYARKTVFVHHIRKQGAVTRWLPHGACHMSSAAMACSNCSGRTYTM